MEDTIIMNIKNNKGYSLVEVLAAIIILLLVTSGIVTGVVLSKHQYQSSITQSEASELYNSLSSLINNELKFTNEIKTDSNNNVTSFYSVSYATKSALTGFDTIDNDGNTTSDYGQIILRSTADESDIKRLLSYGAYTNGLGGKVDSLTYKDGIFTVTLSVGTSDKTIISKTFNVRPLNTIVANKDD